METQLNPGTQPAQDDNQAFKQKIEEAKKVMSESSPAAPKRGRGRPPKQKSEAPAQAPSSSVSTAAPVPAPDIGIYVKQPLIAISRIPAVKYQIPELALNEDEAAACAEALNNVVQAFVPDVSKMDPKTGAVIGALAVFGSVGFQKMTIYRQNQKANPKPPVKEEVQTENRDIQQNSGIDADNYFSRQSVQAAPL